MSPTPVSLAELIGAARRMVRRDVMFAVAGAVLLIVPLSLAVAWLLAGRTVWAAPSPGPLALELLALTAAGSVLLGLRRRWLLGTAERDLASTAEAGAQLPNGAVLGVLELARGVPGGTSVSLFRREEADVGRKLSGHGPREVSGEVGRRARRRRGAVLGSLLGTTAFTGLLGFVSPQRVQTGWSPLLHPLAHLSSPPLPAMVVTPGNTEVLRGADLAVHVLAPGRFAVTVAARADGDVLRREVAGIVADSAVVVLHHIDARTEYWVEAPDGSQTAHYVITPRDPLLVTDLTVVVRYPEYVGRAADRYSTEVPPLELPEGSTLQIDGRATRALAASGLSGDKGEAVRLNVSDDRFSGAWTPAAGGVYEWRMKGQDGSDLLTAPAPLEISLLADAPPVVEITYPGRDTLVDPTLIHAIAADARDDYGIESATLVNWRVSAAGRADPPVEMALPVDTVTDRVLVRGILDLRERDLLPGDTIKYFVRVTDNSPRHQTAVSTTFSLYLPGASDLRDRVTEQTDDMVKQAQDLTKTTKDLQDATQSLQRRTEASNARRNDATRNSGAQNSSTGDKGQLGFRESEQARQILEQQQKVMAGLEQMRDKLEAVQRAMENAGLRDPATQQKLKELREQYEQMMTPDLQQQMKDLQDALTKLDPEQLQKALEQLAQKQDEMRQKLEESLEQMKHAASEQKTGALAQQAKELATQQQALADAMRQKPTEKDAETQRQLEQKAKDLAAQVDQLSKDLATQKSDSAAQQAAQAAQQLNAARQDMNQAAEKAKQKQREEAGKAGQQAADKLDQAAKQLDASRDQQSDASERAMREAIEQATNEALSLAQRQQSLRDKMDQAQAQQDKTQAGQQAQQQQQAGQQQQGQRGQQQQQGQRGQQQGQRGQQQQGQQGQQSGQQGQQGMQGQQGNQQGGQGAEMQRLREEQAALQQGLEQLGRNLSQAADQNGSMSRDVGSSLARANLSMQQTMQGLEKAGQQGQRLPTQEAGQSVDALNRLALSLLKSQQQGDQNQNASGAQQAMEQLSAIAQQQGQLNGRSNALLPLNLPAQVLQQQTTRMAREQRDIASQLNGVNEKLAGHEDVLGRMDELAAEAERLARELEGGRLPAEVIARQERLFHRLLDAGRSLERNETSNERVAERPGAYTPSVAPPLTAALLDATQRYRVPTPEELKDMPPAYRKMILEYFERINRSAGAEKKQKQ